MNVHEYVEGLAENPWRSPRRRQDSKPLKQKSRRLTDVVMLKRGWSRIYKLTQAPYTPGCYAIYQNRELVYIGSTNCLRHRLTLQWATFQHESLSVKVKLSRKNGDWLMIEHRLIGRLRPRYNKTGNGSR